MNGFSINENSMMLLLISNLSKALLHFSENQLSEERALEISISTMSKIDINNEVFGHKGINWLAIEVLKKVKI